MKRLLATPIVAIALTILLGGGVTLGAIYIGGSGRTGEVNLQKGLVGHWNLNGNTKDSTPNRNNGTLNGDAAVTANDRKGQSNKAATFDGTGDYITLPNEIVSVSIIRAQGVAYSAWIRRTATGTQRIVGQQINSGYSDYSSGGLGVSSSGYAQMIAYSDANPSAYVYAEGTTVLEINEWYHIVGTFNSADNKLRIYINGVLEGTPASVGTFSRLFTNSANRIGKKEHTTPYDFSGQIDDVRIYNRAISLAEVQALYDQYDPGAKVSETQKGLVGHWKFNGNAMDATPYSNHGTVSGASLTLDHNGQANTAYSFNTSLESLLMNYRSWKDGQTGSIGSFSGNGSASENYRILGADPWGREIVIWEARPDVTSGADGGWNHSIGSASIDNTKLYRFSVWVNRTVQGNGSFYLGTNGYGSTNGVYNRSNGSNNTNAYFWVSSTPTVVGTWTLVVGHVWPVGSRAGSNHADSGRYTLAGGKIGSISTDFVWRAETTSSTHRSYLYYSTNTDTRQRWAYPRVDLVDGTEPSIQDLLNDYDIYGDDVEADVSEDKTSFSFRYNQSSEGVWTHVANSSGTLYVNGELGTPTYYPVVINGNKVYIGRTTMSDFFSGSIDDVRIYNRALTLSEVQELSSSHNPVMQVSDLQKGLLGYWNLNENARDSTPYRNHGTVSGAALTTDRKGQTNQAYSFNGSTDYVDTADIGAVELADVTFSFWGKISNTTEDHGFIYKGTHAEAQPLLIWFDDTVAGGDKGTGNTNTISVIAYDGSVQHRIAAPTNSINDTDWHQIVVVIDPTNKQIKIYIDGVLSESNTKSWNGIRDTATAIRLGNSTPISSVIALNGQIDDFRIYNRALSPTEITTLYESYQ